MVFHGERLVGWMTFDQWEGGRGFQGGRKRVPKGYKGHQVCNTIGLERGGQKVTLSEQTPHQAHLG